MEKILTVKNVGKKVKRNHIIKDINFDVHENEILGLIGPNGSGKTTIIRSIANLIHIDSGEIKYKGLNINNHFEEVMQHVGVLVESPTFYPDLTGKQNLDLYLNLFSSNNKKAEIERVSKMLGIYKDLNKKVKYYSLGMRQRLAVAQLISVHPKLLILDEPMNGLDPEGMVEFRSILSDLKNSGISIIISSHLLSELEIICDRYIYVNKGEIKQTISKNSTLFIGDKKRYFVKDMSLSIKLLNENNIETEETTSDSFIFKGSEIEHHSLLKLLIKNDIYIISISDKTTTIEDTYLELGKSEEKYERAN